MKIPEAIGLLKTKNKFLVHNGESYLVNSFFNQVQKSFPDKELNKFYDLDSLSETAMRGEMFSSTGRIMVFYEVNDENVNDVQRVVSGVDPQDIIIVVFSKALPKLKSVTRLKVDCETIKFDKPTSQEVLSWLTSRMKNEGVIYKGEIPQKIIELKGEDLYGLEREVGKLKHYANGKEISTDDCNLVVTDTGGVNIFQLVEKFTLKKKRETVEEFEKYSEDQYLQVVATLLTTLDKIHMISLYKEQGKNPDEISSLVGIPKFFLKTKYYPVLSAFGRGKLIRVREFLCDLEVKLKTSRFPKKKLFEHFFVKSFTV